MIKEDYVSLETAKLLKEKGFDEPCDFVYDEGKLEWIHHKFIFLGGKISTNSEFRDSEIISAPTLQMAMKWLREKHNIYIDILTYTTGNNIQFRWVGHEKGRLFSQEEDKTIYFGSHEQACEAAIKYCLEKLI